MRTARAAWLGAVMLVGLAAPPALAWPDRPVHLVTLAGAGGGTDVAARILARALARRWGQPVIVDNRPGADGIVAVEALLAARDGHTLLFTNTGTVTTNPLLHETLSYEPTRDLVPISFLLEDFIAVIGSPTLPARSLDALATLVRARPGALNYASVPGFASFAFAGWQKAIGAELALIPYKNPIGAVPDLLESRLDLAILPLATVLEQARAGRVTLIAVMSRERPPSAPDVPSFAECGHPALAFFAGLGLFAPAAMTDAQRGDIADAARAILADPAVADRLTALGYRPRGTTPTEFAALLQEQSASARAMARVAGVRPQ